MVCFDFINYQQVIFSQWTVVDKEQHRRSVYLFCYENLALVNFIEIKFVQVEGRYDWVELFGLAPFHRPIFIELKLNLSVITSQLFIDNFIEGFPTCTKNLKAPSRTFSRVTLSLYRKTSTLLSSQSCHFDFNSSTNASFIVSSITKKLWRDRLWAITKQFRAKSRDTLGELVKTQV